MIVRSVRAVDVAGASVLCAAGQTEIWTGVRLGGIGRLPADPPRLALAAGVAVTTLVLVLCRRMPLVAVAVVVAALWVQTQWVVPAVSLVAGLLPLLVATLAVAACGTPAARPIGLVVALAGQAAFVAGIPEERAAGEIAFGTFVVTGAWLLGLLVGTRVDQAGRTVAHAATELAAVLEDERARIARELHDVIAHGVSVMGVQAAVARVQLDTDSAAARATLRAVEQQARESIDELQRLLGVLRGATDSTCEPQPGLARLPALVRTMQAAGMPVALTVDGAERHVARGVDLAAYRIVQEALTNTLKHAGPVATTVHLWWETDELCIDVRDRGPVAATASRPGHGLVGMRERVGLYGGVLDAGAAEGGGFRVRARLPLPQSLT